uniref:Adenylate kinase isoenzyme 6 homolog n=1 Tax=Schistosoma japonicum TaxID=6182 RepID=C1LC15_SCHJA|nr:TAF9 RNA polymerase II, TATA box binding protein (TBP)-associated factor [Schistosoma japonicum]
MPAGTLPNILITGTPGTGKTTVSKEVSERSSLNYISINEVAKEGELYDGYDEANECYILDEDRIVDELEDAMSSGGQIIYYHSCEFFPERWFDAVFVLRTDNTILYPRLTSRDYSSKKVSDLIHCEIVQVILDEARESYNTDIVHELINNTPEDLESNVSQICGWIKQWRAEKS